MWHYFRMVKFILVPDSLLFFNDNQLMLLFRSFRDHEFLLIYAYSCNGVSITFAGIKTQLTVFVTLPGNSLSF